MLALSWSPMGIFPGGNSGPASLPLNGSENAPGVGSKGLGLHFSSSGSGLIGGAPPAAAVCAHVGADKPHGTIRARAVASAAANRWLSRMIGIPFRVSGIQNQSGKDFSRRDF